LRPDRLRLEPAEMQRVLALGREIIERGLVRTKVL
jgi:hypothetical protein